MGMKEDIHHAIQAHAAWKARFRDFLSGKTALNLSALSETNHCKFGQWLENEGRKLLPQKSYENICRLHTEFHHAAAEVTRKIKQKDFSGARQDLAPNGAFNETSRALTSCLLKASQQAPAQPSSMAAEDAGETGSAQPAETAPASDSSGFPPDFQPEEGQTQEATPPSST